MSSSLSDIVVTSSSSFLLLLFSIKVFLVACWSTPYWLKKRHQLLFIRKSEDPVRNEFFSTLIQCWINVEIVGDGKFTWFSKETHQYWWYSIIYLCRGNHSWRNHIPLEGIRAVHTIIKLYLEKHTLILSFYSWTGKTNVQIYCSHVCNFKWFCTLHLVELNSTLIDV